MSRLYYETKERKFRGNDRGGNYSDKIVKIIPAEIIGCYVFFVGIVGTIPGEIAEYVKWLVFLTLLFLIPIAINFLNVKKKPVRNHKIVSSLAFVIWAYSISGDLMVGEAYYHSAVASVGVALFTVLTNFVPLDR